MYNGGLKILVPAFLVMLIAGVGKCDFEIQILHTSDMHSRYDEVSVHKTRCHESKQCYGGFARIRAAVDDLTKKALEDGVPTIYLDAGDVFAESVYYRIFKSKIAVEMMNLLKPDVMSLGNHDFDDGVKELSHYIKGLNIPVVCSNMDTSKESDLAKINPSEIKDLTYKGRVIKVGVVGYISQVIPANNIGDLKIGSEIESLKKEGKRLKEQEKANVVIALGHAGYYRDIDIARQVSNIDVIVGGRSHLFFYPEALKPPSTETPNKPYPTVIKNGDKIIPIVGASYATKYLGRIVLKFNEEGDVIGYTGHPILLDSENKDKAITDALEKYKKTIKTTYQSKIGQTEVLLEGKKCVCRFKECNIGNLVTDAFVKVINERYGQPVAQIALIQSGDINANIFPKDEDYTGEIVMEDVMIILPFNRRLEIFQLKGSELRGLLESAVANYSPGKGGLFRACLMQVSGLRLQYDMTKEVGKRLTGAQVASDNQELDDDASYSVVVTDFLANGGDGLQCRTNLKNHQRLMELEDNLIDYLVVSEYISKHSPLKEADYQLQGRITMIDPDQKGKDS